MRLALAFLTGLLLGACHGPSPAALVPAPPLLSGPDALEALTVIVRPVGALCSGVWVSRFAILTAGHCTAGLEVGDAIGYATSGDLSPGVDLDDVVHEARVVAVDGPHDLALLRVASTPPHTVAALHAGRVEQGAFVQTMGHPVGLFYSYSSGDVAAHRRKDFGDGDREWLQSTAPISSGSSGGGLFDYQGRLVGVASAVMARSASIGLYVPLCYIVPFLLGNTL